ncbi:MAG: small subunit ribosomal protein S1, partial [Planctomycetota bacterium]
MPSFGIITNPGVVERCTARNRVYVCLFFVSIRYKPIIIMHPRITKYSEEETFMDTLLVEESAAEELAVNDLIEGKVLAHEGTYVYIDLGTKGTGVIYGREFINARDIIRNLALGDTVKGKIVEFENEDGYIELSLKEARQALIWSEADKLMQSKKVIDLPVKEANKGGIIIDWQGIDGFLPASQLGADNYPRVQDGDKEEIFKELKKLIGKTLSVSIISTNPKEGKLIFSERGSQVSQRKEMVTKYLPGDELDCEVTGAVDFGLFLKIEDGLEGLVHISELDWGLVEDPKKLYKVGEKVRAKVIGVADDKISLSIKALKPNPWKSASERYKKSDTVSGVIIKFNKYGALVAIEEGVSGLIHVSEFEGDADLRKKLELGKSYQF